MAFLSPWSDRLAKIAETAESLLARMQFECEVRAWRVSGPPGASLILGISSRDLVSAEALEALRFYLAPRINARLGLSLRAAHLRLVNLDVDPNREQEGEVATELMLKLLGCTGGNGFEPSMPAPLPPPSSLPLPQNLADLYGDPTAMEVEEMGEDEVRRAFEATRPAGDFKASTS